MTSHEERMALLAGRDLDALDDEERAQVASWTTLLADRDLWADSPPDLEERVVAAVTALPEPPRSWVTSSHRRRGSWVRPLLAGLAAAAAIVAAVLLFSRGGRETVAAFALSGTDLAPTATGKASVYKDSAGFRIELKADNLPALDGGRFYEAWLKSDTGLIPVGTFSKGNGSTVTLWSGVAPQDYPTFSVTIEEPDGNQASSGHRVLAGTIS
jgi:Anti-sigma-K factor rskA, C-terminal